MAEINQANPLLEFQVALARSQEALVQSQGVLDWLIRELQITIYDLQQQITTVFTAQQALLENLDAKIEELQELDQGLDEFERAVVDEGKSKSVCEDEDTEDWDEEKWFEEQMAELEQSGI